jgi:hypothetical protein
MFLGVLFFALFKVDVNRENLQDIQGIVRIVKLGGMNDIVVSLKDKRGVFYITNASAAAAALTVEDLSEKLANKSVTVTYAKPQIFSLLSPVTSTIHITELKLGEEIIFSEP